MTDSIVLRGGTVLTMDDSHTIHAAGDVLVVGDRIEAVGPGLEVPEGTQEIDASGGIVMPGLIDTHRHMWQTAMRAYGADWTLTQYFVWYYLEHGKTFRPEDIAAGNVLSGWESLEAGVTTTVDWSHGLQSVDHADAAGRHAVAMARGGDADEALRRELERVEIVPLGGRGHCSRALAGGEADHAPFRRGPQMRRQNRAGMGGGNGGVVERAEQGTSVGHDEGLQRTEMMATKSPAPCLPHQAPKRKQALPSFDCAIA